MELSTEDGNATRNIADESARYWERTQIKVAFLEKQNMRMLAELMAVNSVHQENVYLRRELTAQMERHHI